MFKKIGKKMIFLEVMTSNVVKYRQNDWRQLKRITSNETLTSILVILLKF